MKYLLLAFLIFPHQLLTAQGLEVLQKNDKYALFLNEERITEFMFDEVSPTAEGGYLVAMNGACGLINERGETTIPIQYDYLFPAGGDGAYIAGQNGVAGVLDANENELLPFVYERVDQYSNSGTAVVKYNGRWSVLRNGRASYDLSKVVFRMPDTYPVFRGNRPHGSALKNQQRSLNGVINFLGQEFLASDRVKREGISGSATVSFVISAKGKVGAPYISDNDNVDFAEVLVGIIQRMPRWAAPAKAGGEAVAMKYSIPVNFMPQK